jgi:enterochelin esterase-like enzyme
MRRAPVILALSALVLAAAVIAIVAPAESSRRVPTTPKRAVAPSAAQLVEKTFRSTAVAGVEHYTVYLPVGYRTSGKRYPVIYALHGLPAMPDSYRKMGRGQWGKEAQRAGRPALVVSPQGARSGDTDPEWHDWGPGRNWETMVSGELVAAVDRTYRTIADRRGRALIGVSAGGYGASIIGMRHPDVYSVIQSWSGYFHPTNPAGDAPLSLGSPEADGAASVHNYIDDAKRIEDSGMPFSFGFFVGDADPRFFAENQQLHRELVRAGVPHAYAVYRGAHSATFWAEHEEVWIGAAVRALARAR